MKCKLRPVIGRLSTPLTYGLVAAAVFSCATPEERPQPRYTPGPNSQTGPRKKIRSSGASVKPGNPAQGVSLESGPDAREYEEIHRLYGAQQYEATVARVRAFETNYPNSPYRSAAENLHGLALLLTRNPSEAVAHFKIAIERNTQNPAINSFLYYNLAKAQFEADRVEDSNTSLSQINLSTLDAENTIKYRFLKAGIDSKKKMPLEACKELLAASRLLKQSSSPGETRKNLETSFDQSLLDVSSTAQLEDLYRDNDDAPLADQLLFRLGSKELNQGQSGKGEIHLRLLVSRFPQSAYLTQANNLLKSWQDQTIIDRKAVGVLLPMKGKFASFGARNLQAIELAFNVFGSSVPDNGINLVIEDSGDDAGQTIKALNQLVMKHHVSAVIGPLLSKGVDQITQRADELGIPMISLSRHAAGPNNFVVQGGLTLQLQAYAIAHYAVQELGLKRFAMVTPKTKVGQEIGQYFWDAVESLGGQIVGDETYTPDETDFRQVVDRLSGLYYTEARNRELDALTELRKQDKVLKRTRKTEKYFGLPPIVDYQAVFIPDDPKIAGQILPTFAYRDVDKVQFLGTAEWNSTELITRAQNYAEGALFVDAFYPQSQNSRVRQFIDHYKETFNQEPSEMDAMAYDAAAVLERSIADAGSSFNRSDLLEKIKKTEGYKGVTGKISFKDGQLLRDLKVLTIRSGQIVETK